MYVWSDSELSTITQKNTQRTILNVESSVGFGATSKL